MSLLVVEEVSQRLGVPVSTVRRWCSDGTLRATKQGKQWVVDESDLPSKPPVKRQTRRATSHARVVLPGLDIGRAVEHVKTTDLREEWVPDCLRHQDELTDPSLPQRVLDRLNNAVVDPAIEVPIPKTPFFTRPAVLLTLEDRIALQAVVAQFAPSVEAALPPSVFSARLAKTKPERYFLRHGPTAWLEWRAAALAEVNAGNVWMVKSDLTSFFDTIPHDALLAEVTTLGVPPNVLPHLRAMLSRWAIAPRIGVPQGPNAMRLVANLYLLPVDQAMEAAGVKYFRYMDDIRIVAPTRDEAVDALRLLERECRARGLLLSSGKTDVVHDDDARADLIEGEDRRQTQYLMNTMQFEKAGHAAAKILRHAIKSDGHVVVRSAKFGLWRLAQLRSTATLSLVLNHLEDLAPVSSVVAAYLRPFIERPKVVKGLTNFLHRNSPQRNPYLTTWLLALMLDHRGPIPDEWVTFARHYARDRNLLPYVRSLAMNLLARGHKSSDLDWLRRTATTEYDPGLSRAAIVSLARAGTLDKATRQDAVRRFAQLQATVSYLDGRKSLPSLIYAEQSVPVGA